MLCFTTVAHMALEPRRSPPQPHGSGQSSVDPRQGPGREACHVWLSRMGGAFCRMSLQPVRPSRGSHRTGWGPCVLWFVEAAMLSTSFPSSAR